MVANNDSNDSLDTVQSLLKTQVNFEKSVTAYEETINALDQSASNLIDSKHYESNVIERRRDEVLEKWEKLKGLATAKSEKLGESKLLFQFLRDADELESWINEKLQTAAEASYREASNLQLKHQKHQTFEAEVTANRGQLDSVIKDGDSLLKTFSIHRETVEKRHKDLTDLWTLLEDLSANKAQRLKEAIQKQTFDRNVTELETWMDEVYGALSSKEYGRDLRSVRNLIKKQEHTEEDIINHEDRVNEILQQAEAFEEADHFQKEEIGERAADVAERFDQLSEPANERKHKLEGSLVLYQFLNDAQEEMDWIREKESLVTSEDYGHNLNGVHNLIKKHEAFEAELITHEQVVQTVSETAKKLVNCGHFATGVIMENCSNLKTSWTELSRLAEIRKAKLNESLATQQYYTQVSEIEAWLKEKLPLVSNEDYGRDETSAQTLLRKHETLQLEFEIFEKRIDELELQCTNMIQQGNCDSDTIRKRQRELQDRYTELGEISSYRNRRLLESCRLHIFLREVDEVEAWIEEKESIVTSDDCGRDLEHVDMLMGKFEAFTRDLVVSGERIAKLTSHAQELLNEEHSDSEIIEERAEQICSRWKILKERTNARLNALDRARDLHAFNRNVEETKAWIQEKEAALMFTDEGARDLSSVQALQRKHEGFQRDLKALGKKVSNLSQDADVLIQKFPDEKRHFSVQKQLITEAWENLQQRASSKKSVLSQSEGLQTFLSDYNDLMSWIDTMMSTVTSDEEASDFSAAEHLFAQHQENQAEVAAHEKGIHDFQEAAQKLMNSGHPDTADIREQSKRLNEAWNTLLGCFSKKQSHLEEVKEVQRFKQEADQLEGWLNARDSDVMSQDVGDSLEAVDALLKKQEDFENILLAKGDHFQGFMRLTNQEMESERQRKDKERQLQKQNEEMRKKKEEKRLGKERQNANNQATAKEEVKPKPKLPERREQRDMNAEHRTNKKVVPEKVELPVRQGEMRFGKHSSEKKKQELPDEGIIKETNGFNVETAIQPQNLHQQFASPLLLNSAKNFLQKGVVEGLLQRKQELDIGGRKASIRAWKTFYTVLADDKLLFYKDKNTASSTNLNVTPAIDLKGCDVEEAVIRKNTFRLFVHDGSEFLFTAKDSTEFTRWLSEIQSSNQSKATLKRYVADPPTPQKNELEKEVNRRRSPNPIITVTSFESDDDDIDELGPPINSPPPDIPAPVLPADEEFETGVAHSFNGGGVGLDDENKYLDDGNFMDILSEEDIHPEFYPDAPTDFNDNNIPDVPLIPPPEIPPDDFRDLEEGMVDDDLIVYPKAPPPPVNTFSKAQTSFDQEGYTSSGSDELPLPPRAIKQHFSTKNQPAKHPKKKRAPPPPRDKDPAARYRSDSQDSDDLVLPPKPPSKPYLKGGHDDKKHDKKKGMFDFLKKKK